MDPTTLLLGALLMMGRKKGASSPSSVPAPAPAATNGSNGHTETLYAGHRYRFAGSIDREQAPELEEIKQLLAIVAAENVKASKRTPDRLTFEVRMPFDVPFHPGTSHPQATWLTLESATEIRPARRRKKLAK